MRKFNKKTANGRWVTLPEDKEVQVKIRPFSLFNLTKIPTENDVDFKQYWNIFNYCAVEWKGMQDNEGKDLKCDEENKKMVFDYDLDVVLFVVGEATKLRDKVISEKEIKNSSTSQPGETKKQEK